MLINCHFCDTTRALTPTTLNCKRKGQGNQRETGKLTLIFTFPPRLRLIIIFFELIDCLTGTSCVSHFQNSSVHSRLECVPQTLFFSAIIIQSPDDVMLMSAQLRESNAAVFSVLFHLVTASPARHPLSRVHECRVRMCRYCIGIDEQFEAFFEIHVKRSWETGKVTVEDFSLTLTSNFCLLNELNVLTLSNHDHGSIKRSRTTTAALKLSEFARFNLP